MVFMIIPMFRHMFRVSISLISVKQISFTVELKWSKPFNYYSLSVSQCITLPYVLWTQLNRMPSYLARKKSLVFNVDDFIFLFLAFYGYRMPS